MVDPQKEWSFSGTAFIRIKVRPVANKSTSISNCTVGYLLRSICSSFLSLFFFFFFLGGGGWGGAGWLGYEHSWN